MTLAAKSLGSKLAGICARCKGRVGYRESARRNGKLGKIHSLDDRYDHDVDELMP